LENLKKMRLRQARDLYERECMLRMDC
jgi:hypothetical protein